MRLLVITTLSVTASSCWLRPMDTHRTPSGCGKDTDCKGSRICHQGHCTDPLPHDGGIDAQRDAQGAGLPNPPPITLPGASPQFHGDWTHSGRSHFHIASNLPKEVARVTTGGVISSSPAVADDGTSYFGSHDRSIYAAAADGSVRFRRPTADLVWSSPVLGPGDALYAGSDDDRLYALDARDGAVRWTFTAGPCKRALGVGPEAARCDIDGITLGPDGTIYASADGLYALTPDGTLKFRFALRSHCNGAAAIGNGGIAYVGCQDGALYAVRADGSKLWDYRTADDIDSSPAIASDGTIYIGSDDHRLYALTETGTAKWSIQTGGDVRSSPAIAMDGTIYVGSFDGGLYAVRPDGTVAWIFHAADRILSSPTIDAAGTILFGSQDDRLYAVASDGKLLWSVLLDGDVDGTPAIGSDGTIYVGADDKALHVLR